MAVVALTALPEPPVPKKKLGAALTLSLGLSLAKERGERILPVFPL